jgi:hypothetical protein
LAAICAGPPGQVKLGILQADFHWDAPWWKVGSIALVLAARRHRAIRRGFAVDGHAGIAERAGPLEKRGTMVSRSFVISTS